ncbi:MAG: LytTR family DNA-binding domain-containing protein [Bacteroidota bacterium]
MNGVKTILIDDEPDAVQVLQLLLEKHDAIKVIGSANSVDEGVRLIKKLQPDLIFLDVEMPEKDGFALLQQFPEPSFQVIFVTAFDQYAIRAIKCSALDYLLKPVSGVELTEAIAKVQAQAESQTERLDHLKGVLRNPDNLEQLVVASQQGFSMLAVNEIISIGSQPGNYAFFRLKSGQSLLCTKPLNHYEQILSDHAFVRIHKSHMVNLRHVKSYDAATGEVAMSNSEKLPVAARRRGAFRKAVNQLLP